MLNSKNISIGPDDIGGLGIGAIKSLYASGRIKGILRVMRQRRVAIRYMGALSNEINRLGPCTKPSKVKLLVKLGRYRDIVTGASSPAPNIVIAESSVDVSRYTADQGFVVSPPMDVVLAPAIVHRLPWTEIFPVKGTERD